MEKVKDILEKVLEFVLWCCWRNKLKRIKHQVRPWASIPGGNRRNEVKITRLRIGHTRLTNGHYLSRGRPPECAHCGTTPLTTKHFLTECRVTKHLRDQMNLPNDLQKLLGEKCPVDSLMNYLKEIRILDDI